MGSQATEVRRPPHLAPLCNQRRHRRATTAVAEDPQVSCMATRLLPPGTYVTAVNTCPLLQVAQQRRSSCCCCCCPLSVNGGICVTHYRSYHVSATTSFFLFLFFLGGWVSSVELTVRCTLEFYFFLVSKSFCESHC